MSYVVLARKYRPQSFSEVYSQEHIVRIFKNSIENNRMGQAYLFTGSRGVGKTSVARILAKSLNCSVAQSINPCNKCSNCIDITESVSPDVVEIDGASNTGVDDVRELQRELLYATASSRYKIIIIDEVHMLSKNAFNALLKTLEEPPANVVFIFATTEPHKVLPTIISRCQRFDFKKIPVDMIVKRLKEIAQIEKINVEDEALYPIAKKADGGMRDALSLMDQVISYGIEHITIKQVEEIFGLVGYEVFNKFMEAVLNNNPHEIITQFLKITEQGVDIQEFINDFLEYLRQFIFIKYNINQEGIAQNVLSSMQVLARQFTEDEILYIINYLIETKNNLRTSATPDILAELSFIKISKITEMKSLKSILDILSSGKLVLDTGADRGKPIGDKIVPPTLSISPNVVPISDKQTEQTPISEQPLLPEVKEKEITSVEAPLPYTSSNQNVPSIVSIDKVLSNVPIDKVTEADLKDHWSNILEQIKANNPLSASYFVTTKVKAINNNTIHFTLPSELATNKLTAEKTKYEEIFSKTFNTNVKLSFEFVPEVNKFFQSNTITLETIEAENSNLADFIKITNSAIRKDL